MHRKFLLWLSLALCVAPSFFGWRLHAQTPSANLQKTSTGNLTAQGAATGFTIVSGQTVTNNGTISNAGTISTTGNLTLASGGNFTVSSGAAAAVASGGAVTFNGTLSGTPTGGTLNLSAVTLSATALTSSGNLTLTPGSTHSVIIGGTDNATRRLDLGVGPAPVPSPSAAYFQPLVWGSGSRNYLSGGYTLFTTAAYPAGIYDYIASFGYNQANTPTAGDIQASLTFESRFQNDPSGVDTEHYYAWNGPVGVAADSGGITARRIWQANTSWGTAYAAPVGKPMGYTNIVYDVNEFALRNGPNASSSLAIDLKQTDSVRSTHTLRWFGSTATFDGGISTTNIASTVSTGTSSLGGATTINATTATYNFSSGDNAIVSMGNAGPGDVGFRIGRNGYASTEYLALGAGNAGSLFGTGANGYFFDSVRGTSPALPFAFRYSNDGGSSYTTLMTLTPNTGVVAFPLTTVASSTTSGAVTIGGGLGVTGATYSGTIFSDGAIRSRDSGANTYAQLSSSGNAGILTLNSNAAANNRYIEFTHGASSTSRWKIGYSGTFPDTWLGFYNTTLGGGVLIDGSNNLYIGNTASAMSGSYNLAVEGGVIDTRTTSALVLKQNGTTAATFANSSLNLTLASTTASTSSNNGALVVGGGIGAAGAVNAGGAITTTASTASTNSTNGSGIFAGGVGIAGNVNIGGTLGVNSGTTTPLDIRATSANAFIALNADQAFYLNSSTSDPSTGGVTTKNSPLFTYRGTYWNGSVSTNADASWQNIVSATAPTYRLSASVGGSERLSINNSGTVNITATTEATTGGAGALTLEGGLRSAKKIITSSDFEVADIGEGIIIKSPNGTRWRITVSDAGAFVATSL